ncbi:hypothetical protein Tco_1329723 [Tanacetum coccineum]
MSTLTFADTHNMIAFLEKPAESDGFHEIIDFLNATQIRYALTVNPTMYTSYIQQFWETAKAKMVNGERGTDCLPTATIFEELARMGYEKPSQKLTFYKAFFSPQWKFLIHTITQCLSAKSTAWNEFSSSTSEEVGERSTAHLPTILIKYPFNGQPSTSSQPQAKTKFQRGNRGRKPQKLHYDGAKPEETRRIKSSNDSLGAQEDASKQGRRTEDIDADAEVTLVNETQERQDEDLMFDTRVLDGDEMFVDATTGEKDEHSTKIDDSTAGEAVTTAGVEDSVALTIPTTVEETLAQTLMEIKAAKPKAKEIVFHDLEKQVSKPTVSVTQPSIKDKGKGIMSLRGL